MMKLLCLPPLSTRSQTWLVSLAFLTCFFALPTAAQQGAQSSTAMTPQDALNQGRAMGRSQAGASAQSIKQSGAAKAQEVIPFFNDTPDGRYGDGRGNPAPAGTQKVLDCSTATPEQLAGFAGKHCDATNFLSRNSTTRPAISISKTDPLFSGAAASAQIGQQMGLPTGLDGSANQAPQCETVIQPGSETYSTQVCHEDGAMREEQCTVGRVIEVNGEFRYECETEVRKLKTIQCGEVLTHECLTAQATLVCPNGAQPANGLCTSHIDATEPALVTGYTCPSGYTLSGTTCSRTETTSASIASYTCPAGSTLSGTSCVTTTTQTQAGTPVYSCPSGYTLSGITCSMQESMAPNVNNTCPSGYTLSGSSCVRTLTSAATISTYTCPSGYSLSGSTCSRTTSSSQAATPVYGCPSGYTLSGSSCTRTLTQNATPQYACPAGYTQSGSSCSTTTSSNAFAYCVDSRARLINGRCDSGVIHAGCGANVDACMWVQSLCARSGGWYYEIGNGVYSGCVWPPAYQCPAGTTLSGTSCVQTITQAATISGYTCPSGYTLSGTTCSRTETTSASIASYTCPAGSTMSGTSCVTTTTQTQTGTPVYSCPSGYTLSGNTCSMQESIAPNVNNTCPSGYTLSGSSCVRTLTSAATISTYTCPSGYSLSGSTCSRTTSSSQAASPVYSCPSGYTLSGTTCNRTLESSAEPQYGCREGGTLNGQQCTYVVTTTSDATTEFSCNDPNAELTPGVMQAGVQSYVCCKESATNTCGTLEGLLR